MGCSAAGSVQESLELLPRDRDHSPGGQLGGSPPDDVAPRLVEGRPVGGLEGDEQRFDEFQAVIVGQFEREDQQLLGSRRRLASLAEGDACQDRTTEVLTTSGYSVFVRLTPRYCGPNTGAAATFDSAPTGVDI
jgi:hypothetical protein